MSGVLFEDIFVAKEIDPDGQKFERVSRLFCESESFAMDVIIDIYVDLYSIKKGEKFRLLLASTMDDNGFPDDGEYNPTKEASMRANNFEYIMSGRVYRVEKSFSQDLGDRLSTYISFGGLLLRLQGDSSNLQNFKSDMSVYLFMKKLAF